MGKSGGAPKGNKNGLKLKDPDMRQRAYQKYCEWLAKGKSQKSFTFEEGNYKCTSETIESYIKNNIVEFDPIHKQFAYAKGLQVWETIVEESAIGINKNANTASLQMVMRNKYGWDKESKEISNDLKSDLNRVVVINEEARQKAGIQDPFNEENA